MFSLLPIFIWIQKSWILMLYCNQNFHNLLDTQLASMSLLRGSSGLTCTHHFLRILFLAQQNVPGSSFIFCTPALKLNISPRSHGSFQYLEMKNWCSGMLTATVLTQVPGPQWTQLENTHTQKLIKDKRVRACSKLKNTTDTTKYNQWHLG